MATKAKNERVLEDLLKVPGNEVCADCRAPAPRWCSWNNGILLCVACASIHRKLGTHISKVKSITLDTFTREQVESIRVMGNIKSNELIANDDMRNPPPTNFDETTRGAELERYIRRKYTSPPAPKKPVTFRDSPSPPPALTKQPPPRFPTTASSGTNGHLSVDPPARARSTPLPAPIPPVPEERKTPVFGATLENRTSKPHPGGIEPMRRGRPSSTVPSASAQQQQFQQHQSVQQPQQQQIQMQQGGMTLSGDMGGFAVPGYQQQPPLQYLSNPAAGPSAFQQQQLTAATQQLTGAFADLLSIQQSGPVSTPTSQFQQTPYGQQQSQPQPTSMAFASSTPPAFQQQQQTRSVSMPISSGTGAGSAFNPGNPFFQNGQLAQSPYQQPTMGQTTAGGGFPFRAQTAPQQQPMYPQRPLNAFAATSVGGGFGQQQQPQQSAMVYQTTGQSLFGQAQQPQQQQQQQQNGMMGYQVTGQSLYGGGSGGVGQQQQQPSAFGMMGQQQQQQPQQQPSFNSAGGFAAGMMPPGRQGGGGWSGM